MAVEGTWNLTLQTPMGVLPATVQLAASGATLSGTMVAVAGEAAIFDRHLGRGRSEMERQVRRSGG